MISYHNVENQCMLSWDPWSTYLKYVQIKNAYRTLKAHFYELHLMILNEYLNLQLLGKMASYTYCLKISQSNLHTMYCIQYWYNFLYTTSYFWGWASRASEDPERPGPNLSIDNSAHLYLYTWSDAVLSGSQCSEAAPWLWTVLLTRSVLSNSAFERCFWSSV